jgi:AcrR family transcriptional regulator
MASRARNRQDAADRKAQIIDQALRIMGEFGYYGFTIQGLAERCGISNAGLLHYFGSKDKLLLALLDEIEGRIELRIAPLVASATQDALSPERGYTAIVELLRAMALHYLEDAALTRFVAALQMESINPAHPAHGWFGDRENETIELFTRLAAPSTLEPVSVARRLYAMLQGLGQHWLRSDGAFDLVGEWEKAVEVILPLPHRKDSLQ